MNRFPVPVNLVQKCPLLTHLKLTGSCPGSQLLYEGFKKSWDIPPGSTHVTEDTGYPSFHLPPYLSCVILQPRGSFRRGPGTSDLIDLANSDLAHGLITEKAMPWARCNEQISSDWLDRLDGGKGCWAAKELAQLASSDAQIPIIL